MAFIDYYKILGVKKDIPQADVKKAYLKRAKQFHPDCHPDDPKAKAKFQALNEAYEVINDPEKRAKYDQYGEHWKEIDACHAQDTSGGGEPFGGFHFGSNGGFSDFFNELFGGGRSGGFNGFGGFGGGRATAAPEQHATVEIDLYTALLGGEVIVQLSTVKKLKLHVKPETQPGTKVRIRGNANARDLIITYQVKLPTRLSERQKELLKQMQRS